MTTYSILGKYIIIIEFILIYLNDLIFKIQKIIYFAINSS